MSIRLKTLTETPKLICVSVGSAARLDFGDGFYARCGARCEHEGNSAAATSSFPSESALSPKQNPPQLPREKNNYTLNEFHFVLTKKNRSISDPGSSWQKSEPIFNTTEGKGGESLSRGEWGHCHDAKIGPRRCSNDTLALTVCNQWPGVNVIIWGDKRAVRERTRVLGW